MTRPTIVFLKSRLSHIGGLEKYTYKLTQAFVKKGFLVKILTTGSPPSWENVEIISLCNTSSFSLYHLKRFDNLCTKWINQNNPNIVFGMERNSFQSHYRAGSGIHAIYLKRRKLIDPWLKSITHKINPLHHYLLKTEKRALENQGLKLMIANSKMVKEEALSTYSIDANKIHVVHNGVEWFDNNEPFERSIDKASHGDFHFLFVGSGFSRKGLTFLIRALSKLRHKFKLTVVGKDKNISYFKKISHSLPINFVGEQKNVMPFYQEADALIIPSIYDPFANVTLEALSMGLFVISSPYNGGIEVIESKSGIVIKDLFNMHEELNIALNFPKTKDRASAIRESVKHLDFSLQLDKIVKLSC